jgi:hypothetical protein
MRLVRVWGLAALLGVLCCKFASAGVVINEIFYHAPNDLEDLQWIELFNPGDQPVDISGWSLDQGRLFTFPKDTAIAAQGYLIVALDSNQFRLNYRLPSLGPLKKPLKHGGGQIELQNAAGERIDLAKFKDHDPWPASPDGYSSSLERICPAAPGETADNWAASPLPPDAPRPGGTPGKKNSCFSAALPPTIRVVSDIPEDAAPKQAINVEIEARDPAAIRQISLLYRTVADGLEGKEVSLPMIKDGDGGKFAAPIPAQNAGTLLRYRIKVEVEGASRFYPSENDLNNTFSTYIHDPFPAAKIPLGFIIHGSQPRGARAIRGFFGGPNNFTAAKPPRGSSAFVYVDPKTHKMTLFDHVNAPERNGGRGYKIHFNKDNTLDGMSTISVLFEGSERFLLAEAMAYDLYHRAGNAAPNADFMRLFVDGRMLGYHLMVENPNRSFLRRNKLDDTGDLFKIRWFGRGVEGQHERKTNVHAGHDDLVALVDQLRKTRGEEQWKVIQDNFNVNQVATYFAINMVLSHWDGYFNNYFPYYDRHGTKKWEMYPWDQDKTWGYYDGIGSDDVFTDMPLTFGMSGDPRPGDRGGFNGGNPFGPGPAWWRPGGAFSSPLLANPQFRKVFLSRVKEILDKNYTEAVYFPLLKTTAERLKEDVILRARLHGSDETYAKSVLDHNIESLQTHLLKRRAFLLEQPELLALEKKK